jgi:hypothetical protein
MLLNCCPDCFKDYDTGKSQKRMYDGLSKKLSSVLKKEITSNDAQEFINAVKGKGVDYWCAMHEYFSNYPSNKNELNPRNIQK